MALTIDLGSQSQSTINSSNVPTDQNISLTLGTNGTLVVDGVDVTIASILGAGLISNTTIQAINGAHVTMSGSVGGVSAGSHLSYDIGANSSVAVQAGLLNLSLLDGTSINFNQTGGTGQFTLTPAAINLSLSTPPIVTGLSNGDRISLAGATSASLNNGVLTFHYPGLLGLDTTTALNLQGIPAGSTIAFDDASDTIVFACFLRGTRIATPGGEVAIGIEQDEHRDDRRSCAAGGHDRQQPAAPPEARVEHRDHGRPYQVELLLDRKRPQVAKQVRRRRGFEVRTIGEDLPPVREVEHREGQIAAEPRHTVRRDDRRDDREPHGTGSALRCAEYDV